jgi:hypothetical protein
VRILSTHHSRPLVLAAIGLALAGCSSKAPTTPQTIPTTSVVPTTTVTTTPPLPSALQPTAPGAAALLIGDWARGDNVAALTVATGPSVTTLFAAHYVAGLAIDRGCSTAFPPIKCTYGPSGGAPPSDPIYELSVSQAPGGWYVSAVAVEG